MMSLRSFLTIVAAATMVSAFAQSTSSTTTTRTFDFPPVALQSGQTAELDVVNGAANSTTTNASCVVAVAILGSTNNAVAGSTTTTTTLTSGQITSVKAVGTGTPVRGVVTITPSTASPRPPCSLSFSFQTYDATGATHVYLTGADQGSAAFGR